MSKNINTKSKGVADVRKSDGETVLRTTNIIDMDEVEVVHAGKGEWDDFELMGSSNAEEERYVAPHEPRELEERVLRKMHKGFVGRKIWKLNLELS